MSTGPIGHNCSHCGKRNVRNISWMDPDKFSDPKKAFMTAAFHCTFCSRGQALKVQFLEAGAVKLVDVIDFKTLIKDDAAPFYIGGANHEDTPIEQLSEDAALSLMTEEQ